MAAIKHLTNHFDEKELTNELPMQPSFGEDSSINMLGGILCCHCDELFHNRADIDNHFAEDHEDKIITYTCNICSKSFEKYTMFGNHCYCHRIKDRFL